MNNGTALSPKFIVGILAFILLLVGAIWFARPQIANTGGDSDQPNLRPKMLAAVGETNYDFGNISMAAGNVSHSFTITNSSSSPLTLARMYTSCMCTTATLTAGGKKFGPVGMPGHDSIPTIGYALAPGKEATVEVIFDPAAHGPSGVGPISRAVRIEASEGAPVELTFTAFVRP